MDRSVSGVAEMSRFGATGGTWGSNSSRGGVGDAMFEEDLEEDSGAQVQ